MTAQGLQAGSPAVTERRLLLGAVMLSAAAYALLSFGVTGQLGRGTAVHAAILLLAALVAHLGVRRLAPTADPILLPAVFLLNGIGLVLIRRVDLTPQAEGLANLQLIWSAVGLIAFIATLLLIRSGRTLARYHYTIGLLTLLVLLTPLLPLIGEERNGARIWVDFGVVGFQPGELVKIGLVIFTAGYLERKRALLSIATHRLGPLMVPELGNLGPVLGAVGIALGVVVLQRDLGPALLIFGITVSMLYVATGRLAYPVVGSVSLLAGGTLAWLAFDHVQARVAIWLDPWSRLFNEGWQLAQVSFALGTGGLTGRGLGFGLAEEIPYAHTDTIFAVLGEELGLLGGVAVLVLYFIVVARGYRIALRAVDEFGTLLAFGLTTALALQVFIIVGGLLRLVPFSGITLPFVSYGGSSLLSNYILIALLLRVSEESGREARQGVNA